MARSRIVAAAKVIVYINGKKFGQVTGFSWQSITQRKPAYGLDSGEPYEFMPLTTKCMGSVSVIKTIADGGVEGRGAVARFEDLPREKYFSIMLVERTYDMVIFQADRCVVNAQSWDVQAKGILTGRFEFETFTWNNEIRKNGNQ